MWTAAATVPVESWTKAKAKPRSVQAAMHAWLHATNLGRRGWRGKWLGTVAVAMTRAKRSTPTPQRRISSCACRLSLYDPLVVPLVVPLVLGAAAMTAAPRGVDVGLETEEEEGAGLVRLVGPVGRWRSCSESVRRVESWRNR